MKKQSRKVAKRCLAFLMVLFLLSINSFAAVVSDNDGSAFITKAEFDSLKNTFQTQIDQYNTSIDSKIDGAIAAYLEGIRVSKDTVLASALDGTDRKVRFRDGIDTDVYKYWANCATYINSWDTTAKWGVVGEAAGRRITTYGKKIPQPWGQVSIINSDTSNRLFGISGNLEGTNSAWTNQQFIDSSGCTTNISGYGAGTASRDTPIYVNLGKTPNGKYYPIEFVSGHSRLLATHFIYPVGYFKKYLNFNVDDVIYMAPMLEVGDFWNTESLKHCAYKLFIKKNKQCIELPADDCEINVALFTHPFQIFSQQAGQDLQALMDSNEVPKDYEWADDAFYGEGYLDTVGMEDFFTAKITSYTEKTVGNSNWIPSSGSYTYRTYKVQLQLINSSDFMSQYGYYKFNQEAKPYEGFRLLKLPNGNSGKVKWTMTIPAGVKYSVRSSAFTNNITTPQASNIFESSAMNVVLTGTGSPQTYETKELAVGDEIWIKAYIGNYSNYADIIFGDDVILIMT